MGIFNVFCDWITIVIAYKHDKRLENGNITSVNAAGEVEYVKHKRHMVEASSSARVSLRSVQTLEMMGHNEDVAKFTFKIHCLENPRDKRSTRFDALEISGNPTKWLNRGHNIWGSTDIEGAIALFIQEVLKEAGIELNLWELKQVKDLQVYPNRIDLTTNFRMDSENDAKRWLDAVCTQSKSRYQAAKGYGTSAYFGERSKRKTTVFYKKKEEVMRNSKKLKKEIEPKDYKTIIDEAETLVRFEMRLHSQWFRAKKVNTLANFIKIMGKIDMMRNELEQLKLGQMDLSDDEVNRQKEILFDSLEGQRIRASVISTFNDWKNGENPRRSCSANTYWKYKKIIKGVTGIDIANERVISKKGKVVPLVTYITAYASAPSQDYARLMHA